MILGPLHQDVEHSDLGGAIVCGKSPEGIGDETS
jgi:hypothetical protein